MIVSCGALFLAKTTNRFLFLQRQGAKYSNTWGLVGGKVESGETVINGLNREILEEIGFLPEITKYIPLETYTSSDTSFKYHTFICTVSEEFLPKLNKEHCGYCWTSSNNYPYPLHPGLKGTFNYKVIQNKIKTIME